MNYTTISRHVLAAAALVALHTSQASAQAREDHPLVPRFVGSTLLDDSSVTTDEYPLITGPLKRGKFTQVQRLEGKISHFHYKNPPDRSTFEIFKAYRSSLQEAGFQILFSCSDLQCGDPANEDFYRRWIGRWCEGIAIQCPEPMRYIAAKLTQPTGDVYVAIQVRTNTNFNVPQFQDGTFLNVIEVK